MALNSTLSLMSIQLAQSQTGWPTLIQVYWGEHWGGIIWVEPVAISKHMDLSPHQREFCAEGLLGRHALGMLEKTLMG